VHKGRTERPTQHLEARAAFATPSPRSDEQAFLCEAGSGHLGRVPPAEKALRDQMQLACNPASRRRARVDSLACRGVSCGYEYCLRLQVLQLLAEHIAGSHGIIERRVRGRGTTDGQVPSGECYVARSGACQGPPAASGMLITESHDCIGCATTVGVEHTCMARKQQGRTG